MLNAWTSYISWMIPTFHNIANNFTQHLLMLVSSHNIFNFTRLLLNVCKILHVECLQLNPNSILQIFITSIEFFQLQTTSVECFQLPTTLVECLQHHTASVECLQLSIKCADCLNLLHFLNASNFQQYCKQLPTTFSDACIRTQHLWNTCNLPQHLLNAYNFRQNHLNVCHLLNACNLPLCGSNATNNLTSKKQKVCSLYYRHAETRRRKGRKRCDLWRRMW